MKRYLIVSSWDELYMYDQIAREHLVKLKNGTYDWVIDTQTGTYFDINSNNWVKIREIS